MSHPTFPQQNEISSGDIARIYSLNAANVSRAIGFVPGFPKPCRTHFHKKFYSKRAFTYWAKGKDVAEEFRQAYRESRLKQPEIAPEDPFYSGDGWCIPAAPVIPPYVKAFIRWDFRTA